MAIPKNFKLSKVKVLKDGGIDINYTITESTAYGTFVNKYHIESTKDVHPDLYQCLKKMVPTMANILNYKIFASYFREYNIQSLNDLDNELMNKIEIRGISLSGNDDKEGCVITAVLTVLNGLKIAVNSPRIKFDSETYGFEDELFNIIKHLTEEVAAFLFNDKRAQLSLFNSEAEENESDEEDESNEEPENE